LFNALNPEKPALSPFGPCILFIYNPVRHTIKQFVKIFNYALPEIISGQKYAVKLVIRKGQARKKCVDFDLIRHSQVLRQTHYQSKTGKAIMTEFAITKDFSTVFNIKIQRNDCWGLTGSTN